MANINQMENKLNQLKDKKSNIQLEIDKQQEDIDTLREEIRNIDNQIDRILGVQEDADGNITTTTAGNISTVGGQGNYAPKLGPMMRRKKKNKVELYIDKLFK